MQRIFCKKQNVKVALELTATHDARMQTAGDDEVRMASAVDGRRSAAGELK